MAILRLDTFLRAGLVDFFTVGVSKNEVICETRFSKDVIIMRNLSFFTESHVISPWPF